jgi:hypothetical protein
VRTSFAAEEQFDAPKDPRPPPEPAYIPPQTLIGDTASLPLLTEKIPDVSYLWFSAQNGQKRASLAQ